jgi:hypothetical protein
MADVPQGAPPATDTPTTPPPTDDWRLNPYRDILAGEQAGTLKQPQIDALARLRASGRLAPLDQALQASAPPSTIAPGSPDFVNAPTATMDNPQQGAADEQSFNPVANLLPTPTYRPYDTGLADRLGLVPLVQKDEKGRTPTGANAPDLTTQHEFGDRLLASVQQLPRALETHPLTTGARILGNTLGAPGSVLGAATEEHQGSNVGNAVAGGTDLLNALLFPTPPGYLGGGMYDAARAMLRSGRGVYRLLQMLQQVPAQGRTPQTPPAAPGTQGPLPPTGPQSPYYVPPGTTYH